MPRQKKRAITASDINAAGKTFASDFEHRTRAIADQATQPRPCLAGNHPEPIIAEHGPPGPAAIMDLLSPAPGGPVIHWPSGPSQAFRLQKQTINRQAARLLDAKPATRPVAGIKMPRDHPEIVQAGICRQCRQTMEADAAGKDHTKARIAILRWGVAIQAALAEQRIAFNEAIKPVNRPATASAAATLAEPSLGRSLNRFAAKQTARQRTSRPNPDDILELQLATEWRSPASEPATVSADASLPFRLVMHCLPGHRIQAVAGAAYPTSKMPGADGLYPHRLLMGMPVNTADAREHLCAMMDKAVQQLAGKTAEEWLVLMCQSWDFIYMAPDDYASRKRLRPAARRRAEQAVGQRITGSR